MCHAVSFLIEFWVKFFSFNFFIGSYNHHSKVKEAYLYKSCSQIMNCKSLSQIMFAHHDHKSHLLISIINHDYKWWSDIKITNMILKVQLRKDAAHWDIFFILNFFKQHSTLSVTNVGDQIKVENNEKNGFHLFCYRCRWWELYYFCLYYFPS